MLCSRLALLQRAINRSRDFQNAVSSLDYALLNLPNNSANSTDGVAQIITKEKSQKVKRSHKPVFFFTEFCSEFWLLWFF